MRPLSRRQAEVEQLLLGGLTVKEIAAVLGLTYDTIDFHKRNLYFKRGVHSRVQLARLAVQRGEEHMLGTLETTLLGLA